MFKKNLFFPILLLFLILTSCSGLVRKTAIRTSAELFKEAAESITAETDWNYFKESAPAGIKTLEGFLSLEPSNQSLLRTLARAHAGYVFFAGRCPAGAASADRGFQGAQAPGSGIAADRCK